VHLDKLLQAEGTELLQRCNSHGRDLDQFQDELFRVVPKVCFFYFVHFFFQGVDPRDRVSTVLLAKAPPFVVLVFALDLNRSDHVFD
jgi:hypothetical protein